MLGETHQVRLLRQPKLEQIRGVLTLQTDKPRALAEVKVEDLDRIRCRVGVVAVAVVAPTTTTKVSLLGLVEKVGGAVVATTTTLVGRGEVAEIKEAVAEIHLTIVEGVAEKEVAEDTTTSLVVGEKARAETSAVTKEAVVGRIGAVEETRLAQVAEGVREDVAVETPTTIGLLAITSKTTQMTITN